MRRSLLLMKLALIFSLLASVLAGCSSSPSVKDSYPLESVNQKGSQTSYVYRAANKSVPEVAKELSEERKPDQISKEDPDRMFLVYSDEWYHLQKDPKHSSDTLIEVDNKEYVRNNYSPSFLEGYLLASILNDLFDFNRHRQYGDYRGYTSKDTYKPKGAYHTPTKSDRKSIPPMTVQGTGSIIKRGSKSTVSVGSDGRLFKKEKSSSSSSTVGKITKSFSGIFSRHSSKPQSGSWFSPRTHSPPRMKVGGFGRITRRR